MIVQEEILDAEEVASLLRINARTVKRLAGQRVLPGFQVAGKWRFRRAAIEEYIKKLEQGSQQEQGPGRE